jgi:hypothetical protein
MQREARDALKLCNSVLTRGLYSLHFTPCLSGSSASAGREPELAALCCETTERVE